jgi:DNA polymerase lambda
MFNNATVECCGSYRRGKATCGDIDILIAGTDNVKLEPVLVELESMGVLKERLSAPKTSTIESYMGVCKHPEDTFYRRIDIKVYP